jgi:predicted nucleic acid-binding protein
MIALPRRILLDTNVYVVGLLEETSFEAQVLDFLAAQTETIILFSSELEEQLRRVGRRLADKDWAGFILYLIWRDYAIDYVIPPMPVKELEDTGDIPREDLGIYLTALMGEADCFVSANRELVKQVAVKQRVFACLTPEEFVKKYIQAGG